MPQRELKLEPIDPEYVRTLEAENRITRAIASDPGTDATGVGRLVRLFMRTGFPVDGPSPEREYSGADLAALWGCPKDAVSDILKDFEARGAIARAHRFYCRRCTYKGPRHFPACPHCGEAGQLYAKILITALAPPASSCLIPPRKTRAAPGQPLLRHDADGCRHTATAPNFTPYRRCPQCGAIDSAEHFPLCRKRSSFLRVLPPPVPPTPEEQAELDALEQAELEAAWERTRATSPIFDNHDGPPARSVAPPPALSVVREGEREGGPAPRQTPESEGVEGGRSRNTTRHQSRPESDVGACLDGGARVEGHDRPEARSGVPRRAPSGPPAELGATDPCPPKRNVTLPEPTAPATVEPSDHWQCLCGGRVFNLKQGRLYCTDCGTQRRVPGPRHIPIMPEGP